MRSIGRSVLAIVVCGAPGLRAQGPPLSAPARVRVLASPLGTAPVIATVTARHGDSLLLSVPDRGPVALPLAAVQRIEVSRGTRGKTAVGALVGLAVGTVATAVFLATFCNDPDTLCASDEHVRAFAVIALPATGVGAIVGTLVRSERWERVAPERFALGGAAPLGVGLRVHIPTHRVRRLP